MRASCSGCASVLVAERRRSARAAAAPSASAFAVAGEHRAQLVVVVAGEARGLERDQERRRLLPVRVVARVDHLLRRDLAVEVEQVDRAPRRRVEEDALAAAPCSAASARQVGDAGVGDDQRRLRVAVDERCAGPSAIGGRPRPPWIRIGTRRSAASSNTGASRSSVAVELLRARVELDPARAGVEAAASPPRSATRSGRAARTGSAARSSARRTRACGRSRRVNAGMPVGLVEAEHERARDAVAAHQLARAGRSRRPCRRCRARGAGGRRRCRRPSGSSAPQLLVATAATSSSALCCARIHRRRTTS